MKYLSKQQNEVKAFWEKKIRPLLPDDEIEWEQLSIKDQVKVNELYLEILATEYMQGIKG